MRPSSARRRRLLLAIPALALAGVACRGSSGETMAPRPLRYVAIGASDTVGVGANVPEQESWPAVLHRRLPAGSQLVNLGVSGSLLRQALDQQLPVAVDSAPDLVTVWLAVNDYGARAPLEPYLADLGTLLGELRSKTRATVLVGNVPDLSSIPADGRFDLRFVDRWNAGIEDIVRRHEATLVDLGTIWQEVKEHPEYISSDGFHPSTAGYRRLADVFYASAVPRLGLPA
jgi:lysophospholipase L1-like esterase